MRQFRFFYGFELSYQNHWSTSLAFISTVITTIWQLFEHNSPCVWFKTQNHWPTSSGLPINSYSNKMRNTISHFLCVSSYCQSFMSQFRFEHSIKRTGPSSTDTYLLYKQSGAFYWHQIWLVHLSFYNPHELCRIQYPPAIPWEAIRLFLICQGEQYRPSVTATHQVFLLLFSLL